MKKNFMLMVVALLLFGCSSDNKPELKPPYVKANLQSMPFHASDMLKQTIGEKFSRTGNLTIVRPEQAISFFGEEKEPLLLTYQFVGAASTKYKTDTDLIYAEVLEFADNQYAYGYYALNRPDGVPVERIGVEAYRAGNSLYFARGVYMVTLSADEETETSVQALTDLATAINNDLVANTKIPPYFMLFPFSGRINPSSKFFPYQFMEMPGLNDVYTSKYTVDEDTVLLFLTMDTAGQKLEWVRDYAEELDITVAEVKKLDFDNYQGIAFEYPGRGVLVCGLKAGKLVGAVGYKPKFHNKLVSGWIDGFK